MAGVVLLRRLARPGLGLGHSLALLLALPPVVLWAPAALVLGRRRSPSAWR
ncbi:MAG: hypothetical protein R3E55_08045 [Burkholderiaceae bacterium]